MVRKFMNLNPKEQVSIKAVFDRVNDGEALIGLGQASSPFTTVPGNVGGVYLDPTVIYELRLQINRLAPHPNAGRLFALWQLSEAGQRAVSETGRPPSKLNVQGAVLSLDTLVPKGIELVYGSAANPDIAINPSKWENWIKPLTGKK